MSHDSIYAQESEQVFETMTTEELSAVHGSMSSAARFIMMHESNGSTTAGHLHSRGRGDGRHGNHSSAFGAFQMIKANRKRYMGADFESTDFNKQYAAASRYVRDRYGSWEGAAAFWRRHRWY